MPPSPTPSLPPPGAHHRFCPSSSSLGSSAPPGPSGPSSFFSTSTGAILRAAATKSDLSRARRGPRSSLSPARPVPLPPSPAAAAAAPGFPLPAAPCPAQRCPSRPRNRPQPRPRRDQAAPGQPRQRLRPGRCLPRRGAALGSAPWCRSVRRDGATALPALPGAARGEV